MNELSLHEEESFKTPLTHYNEETKHLLLKGRLIPEDPLIFFNMLEDWMEKFKRTEQKELIIELYLYYYNTSSLKRMVDFLKRLDVVNSEGKNIRVVWKYDDGDEDNLEDGNDFKKMLNLDFQIVVAD